MTSSSDQLGPISLPVTVVVRRQVKPGKEQDYENWLAKLTREARDLPGYLGASLQRPPSGSREYVSIFRFDTVENLDAFERSDLRASALADVAPLVEADAIWQKLSGWEVWFAAPDGAVVPTPSRFRMALVLVAVVFTLVMIIGSGVAFVFSSWPYPARLLLTLTVEVFLLTYVIMPPLTRAIAPWIYPKPRSRTR